MKLTSADRKKERNSMRESWGRQSPSIFYPVRLVQLQWWINDTRFQLVNEVWVTWLLLAGFGLGVWLSHENIPLVAFLETWSSSTFISQHWAWTQHMTYLFWPHGLLYVLIPQNKHLTHKYYLAYVVDCHDCGFFLCNISHKFKMIVLCLSKKKLLFF